MKKFIINSVEGFAVQNSKLLIILLIINCSLQIANAQPGNAKRANHWFFGWNAGLDFSSGTMQDDPNGQANIDEGTASISDTAGNLLFYAGPNFFTYPNDSNMNIYNRNHQIMQNGTDIDCGWSGRQNSIIVPLPESDNLYYLFTLTDITVQIDEGYNVPIGFKYNIIDMDLNGGLGAVTQKNIPIYIASVGDTLSEILTAVHHANCKDVWIMIHRFNADEFLAYKLTKNGLDTVPVVNHIGYHAANCIGWGMKFSPNGKMAVVSKDYSWLSIDTKPDTLELYKFNNTNGVLNDLIQIPIDSIVRGKEFSQENNFLYTFQGTNSQLPMVYQYNLSEWNKISILNSKTYIGSYLFSIPDLHITPLNTIIMTGEQIDTIGVIEYPNEQGLACSVNPNALTITNNTAWNCPNFICSYFNTDTTAYNCNTSTTEQVIKNQRFKVFPNPLNKQATINTTGREIIYYNLYDLKGKQQTKNKAYKLKQQDNTYLFTNKKLKGGIYILSGVFADKGQFNIKLIIN